MDPILASFLVFMAVGFLAQLVDGAVGMAYGVTAATVLLAFGVPPANVSASVHASKVFTCAASAWAHVRHGNTNGRLAFYLGLGGVAGGVVGAYVLTSIPGSTIKPVIILYLGIMGVIILVRSMRTRPIMTREFRYAVPLGGVGGLLDAIGGGGWGPTVTTTLIGSGVEPRIAIGSTNTAEFFVALAVSSAFLFILATGRWEEAGELTHNLWPVLGLIAGGLIAAPFAARVTRVLPATRMTWIVGLVVIGLALWQGLQWAEVL
jgi:uncharacterized membrane protein YfcA